ncbi:acyl-CoA carboxylase subunit epsilon [Streptomyces sp. STR69]|uniref:acyl-CoA carboxylase subunit epsilon n=1 Tax=Streptomyces sp. STR69 TaxID=1796942 RepID=UPI0021CA9BB0|nr:acyl-CoA carboxylase subunit epsilon [Streptomyces sp. STR69]
MGDVDCGQQALRVERGTATEEELAALTVVLLALRGRRAPEEPRERPVSASRWWLRRDDHHGAHSWR